MRELLRKSSPLRRAVIAWGSVSIFLLVDRSINEIHRTRTLFSIEVLYKNYVFITDIFYVNSFSIKFVKSSENAQMQEPDLFLENLLYCSEG